MIKVQKPASDGTFIIFNQGDRPPSGPALLLLMLPSLLHLSSSLSVHLLRCCQLAESSIRATDWRLMMTANGGEAVCLTDYPPTETDTWTETHQAL